MNTYKILWVLDSSILSCLPISYHSAVPFGACRHPGFWVWGLSLPFSRWRVNTEETKVLQALSSQGGLTNWCVQALRTTNRESEELRHSSGSARDSLHHHIPSQLPQLKNRAHNISSPTKAVRGIIALLWIPQMKGTTEEQTAIIVSNLCPSPVILNLLNNAYSIEESLPLQWRKSLVEMTVAIRAFIPLCSTPFSLPLGWLESYNPRHLLHALKQSYIWALLFLYPKHDCYWINSLFVVYNDIHSRDRSCW